MWLMGPDKNDYGNGDPRGSPRYILATELSGNVAMLEPHDYVVHTLSLFAQS